MSYLWHLTLYVSVCRLLSSREPWGPWFQHVSKSCWRSLWLWWSQCDESCWVSIELRLPSAVEKHGVLLCLSAATLTETKYIVVIVKYCHFLVVSLLSIKIREKVCKLFLLMLISHDSFFSFVIFSPTRISTMINYVSNITFLPDFVPGMDQTDNIHSLNLLVTCCQWQKPWCPAWFSDWYITSEITLNQVGI